ncbi:MAG: ATP-dependent DNA helicase RecG [Candidatus Mcinerneyibacterium aminivorans]|uniref:ATP-dependent DNA helicase RecG n=1 Tax=Candidatus Mcinerneyibacterium aminivorans TaxID=2703815 RepID=A0A5D0MB25_9BACT|nr:MAG: ATP-dependent DNA helicase RecG [Candidatus Mcinerneyibacterium aminivorans]
MASGNASIQNSKRCMKIFDELKEKNVQYVKGVGPKNSKKLQRLDIDSVLDLLFYIPYEYEDRRNIKKTTEAEIGQSQSFIVQIGNISSYRTRSGKKIYSVFAYDNYGSITLTWFNNPKYLFKKLDDDKYYFVFGEVKVYGRELQIVHPEIVEYEKGLKQIKSLLPIYHLTEGLTQNYMRKIVRKAFDKYLKYVEDPFPESFTEKHQLMDLKKAIKNIHFPKNNELKQKSRKRIIFGEFLAFNYIMEKRKALRKKVKKEPYTVDKEKKQKFVNNLPFELTKAQKKVIREMEKDLTGKNVMYRLLQGDVGSGKTVVAAYLIYIAFYNNKQSAFMAPTTILVNQHYENIKKYLQPLGVKIGLLTGSVSEKKKKEIVSAVKNGTIDLLIGTHALIYDRVEFNELDLVLIDEQHKFGVKQRKDLKNKGENPHYLIMTATPIPRSTALVYYGDTEISIIDEMPEGRKEIKTGIRYEKDRIKMYEFLKKEINKNNQIYVVYPLIEENDELDLKSAESMYKEFVEYFGEEEVALLHGRMKDDKKRKIMTKFSNNEISILVSTTVIEVGVDSPNATVLVVEHPERFGLAQLHQLRGRVGRSDKQSYCILFISSKINEETFERLKKFSQTSDGFKIAKMDLKARGSGKLLGKMQHGALDFKIGNVIENRKLFLKTKKIAQKMIKNSKKYWNYAKYCSIYFPRYNREIDADHR